MKYEDLEVTILANGIPLEEHRVEVDGNTIICYIEAQTDAAITIHAKNWSGYNIGFCTCIDGNSVYNPYTTPGTSATISDTFLEQTLRFGVVDVAPATNGESPNEIGSIIVKCCEYGRKKYLFTRDERPLQTRTVEKASIRTNPVTHSVRFGPSTKTECEYIKADYIRKICTFIFKYRSYNLLVAEGIIETPVKIEDEARNYLKMEAVEAVLSTYRKRKAEREAEECRKHMRLYKTAYKETRLDDNKMEIDLTEEPCMDLIRYVESYSSFKRQIFIH